jgi:hypothetical protein
MAVVSLLLAAFSLLFIPLGVVLSPIPIVGSVFAFGAAALSLGGIITGGVAMSRAKRAAQPTGIAQTGVILSALSLVPALLTALTCGVCNALVSSGGIETHRGFDVRLQQGLPLGAPDGGPVAPSAPEPPPTPAAPSQPGAPPPAFPPPPIGH